MNKPVTWGQGISIVGGIFGICCAGFFLLHRMILDDKAYATSQLSIEINERTRQSDRLFEMVDKFKDQNNSQHQEILRLLQQK